jgi:hypothetical protein
MTVSNCTAFSKKNIRSQLLSAAHIRRAQTFEYQPVKVNTIYSSYSCSWSFMFLFFKPSEQCKHKAIVTKVMWLSVRQLHVYCPIRNKRMFVRSTDTTKRHRVLKNSWVRRGKETAACVSVLVCECVTRAWAQHSLKFRQDVTNIFFFLFFCLFVHPFSHLSHDRSKASSKASSLHSEN